MNDYDRLRQLLLHDETAAIRELQQQVEGLLSTTQTGDKIIARLSPYLDGMIREKIITDKDSLVDALSPVIADVLEQQIKVSSDTIAKALAPVISEAMKVQISTKKDEMIEVLYPIIGGMIMKYISQAMKDMLDAINQSAQESFSFKSLRRKLMAKIKGVSEADLLIQESQHTVVQSVFLIHKHSGLLMAEADQINTTVVEPEMVASMLTAIRSFVNEWVAQNEPSAEVHQIEYGDSTIYLEVAGYSYLALVLKGEPNQALLAKANETLAAIVEHESRAIEHFSGDAAELDMPYINEKLEGLLAFTLLRQTPQNSSKLPSLLLGLLLLGGLGYGAYQKYLSYQQNVLVETLDALLRQHSALALYRLEVSVETRTVYLRGTLPSETLHHEALETLKRQLGPSLSLRDEIVVIALPEPAPLRPVGILDLEFLDEVAFKIYFDQGSSGVRSEDMELLYLVGRLLHANPNSRLSVLTYTDQTGSKEANRLLSQQRSQSVRQQFEQQLVATERITSKAFAEPSPDYVPEAGDEKARMAMLIISGLKKSSGSEP